ncbi:Na(+)-translocating NADH-quinone reductase subunit C [Marinomonas spartinae]|uniref:Na(+)-translocating NADH-quinone reductase subunit C n=1 Tax=Marinomonas spartinae TaxID=1792290 RepID=A0A1A8TBP5_9GAMM|nr:Na(+)-translocating NADH-quinone reductase subunit C [Marinomonas spartinae]SBS30401.1 Na(+)-translocating NADH-quinone reductase subunit C [Marinomonas spartinae]SBS36652.1 Na(+)-translocating NADH-quinone reductase subunit C [Marinomonas spartinae]
MASGNESIKKTILVALALCLVCSIFVAAAAVGLKPIQKANKALDRKQNILAAAGMLEPGKSVDELFKRVETRIVNLNTGEFATPEELKAAGINPQTYDQKAAAQNPKLSRALPADEDPADIKRRAKYAPVYLVMSGDKINKIVLPVHGYGLWSTMYGFIALKNDYSTVVGFGFYDQGETPGLGGEVDNPNWKALWKGKEVYNNQGKPVIRLVKGGVNNASPDAIHEVDALSGATLTSRGVTHLVQYWMGKHGFGPFLAKLRSKGVQ